MKKTFFTFLLFVSTFNSIAQNGQPVLLLDGFPSGSIYNDSIGILTLSGQTDYQIFSYTIVSNDTYSINGKDPNASSIGALLRILPSQSNVSIQVKVGCENCVTMMLEAHYIIP